MFLTDLENPDTIEILDKVCLSIKKDGLSSIDLEAFLATVAQIHPTAGQDVSPTSNYVALAKSGFAVASQIYPAYTFP